MRSLGIPAVRWSSRIPYGGGGSQGMSSTPPRPCSPVPRGRWWSTGQAGPGREALRAGPVAPEPVSGHSGTTAMQWATPFGVLTPASWMSFESTRYMHETGTTSADFGRAVVQFRAYAATNPAAYFHGRPITWTTTRPAVDRRTGHPAVRLLPGDRRCGRDGRHRRKNGRPTPRPGEIAAAASFAVFEEEVASNHYRPDLPASTGRGGGGEPVPPAGIERADVDVAMIYDAFTPMFFLQLEALGSAATARRRTSWPTGTSGPPAPCRATPTAGSSARPTSTG